MENILMSTVPGKEGSESVKSIVRVAPHSKQSVFTDGFDELYVVVVDGFHNEMIIKNILYKQSNIQVRWMDKDYFVHIIQQRSQRRFVQWVLQGEIVYDHDCLIKSIREKFHAHPSDFQKRKICIEFTYFLRQYLEAKEYVENGHFLDAYGSMIRALHHWARLSIIQEGQIPETIVWKQVQSIDYAIYKLYEELVTTSDPLEKRLELLLLASEFSMVSKIKEYSEFLLMIIESRSEAWSVNEILNHPDFQGEQTALILLLEKLVKRSLLKEVQILTEYGIERKYSIS